MASSRNVWVLSSVTALSLLAKGAWAQGPAASPSGEDELAPTDTRSPPPAGLGTVWGVVRSGQGGAPLPEALVVVVGQKALVATDLDGKFRLDLPPGTYSLRVVADVHAPARVNQVVVRQGYALRVDVPLRLDTRGLEEVEAIEADVERSGTEAQLALRRSSARASDSIGAQDIAKTPDRNAADAVRRVVGATVVDGRYITVRGLGDRYTNSLLNGAPLPSPEPDRQAVPLDMFPTLVISDLTVHKTFTPDMPGNFAGGTLDIHTRDQPEKLTFQVQAGLGMNSISTFTKRLDYPGGSTDWLGMDDGGRALSRALPATRISRIRPDGTLEPNLTEYGRAVSARMGLERTFTLPHGSLSAVFGNSHDLGKKRKLGYMVGLSYSRKFSARRDEIIRTYGVDPSRPGQLLTFNDYRGETGLDTVGMSGIGSLSYSFDDDHKLTLTTLGSRMADKESRRIEGFNEEQATEIRDERQRFLGRQLVYGHLKGDHRLRALNDARLTWNAVVSRATMSDPNLRESVYALDPTAGYVFRESTQSGQHFYAQQGETTRVFGLDWLQPLKSAGQAPNIKLGALATLRARSFRSRRFRFIRNPSADAAAFRQGPEQLFTPDNVGSALELEEWTRPTDSYAAHYDVLAGYAMTDVPLGERLRVVVGERIEAGQQRVDSFDPFAPAGTLSSTQLNRTDLLPSANVIVKLSEKQNLRFAATKTVARPQLRELAPFVFSDFLGAREILGNPELDRTTIANFDARWELFPGSGQVLAVSGFHKRFHKPIEPIIIPTSRGVMSYQNAAGAENTGVELEGRKSLDFLWKKLDEFSLLANFAVIHSRVELDAAQGGVQTSSARPLAGQSPYVLNLALDWAHDATKTRLRALYNVAGARIAQVGQNGIPDTYEQPRHLLDLSAAQGLGDHFDVKATIENLLDAPVKWTQGDDAGAAIASSYRVGTTAWVLGTYTY